jgi:small subunit ribosomal protein S6
VKLVREYELTVVYNPEISEEDFPEAIEKVNQLVTQRGGEIIEVNHWGRRKLAYPINHLIEGNYVLTRLKLEPSSTKQLESILHASEEILRHLLVRLEE